MTATTTPVYNPVISNSNSVTVLGCVARDPEVRVNKDNGRKFMMVTVAGEELVTDAEGKTRRLPFYEQATYAGKRADQVIALGLKAGDAVLMDGKFTMREFTDRDGVEQKNLEIEYTIRRALGFEKADRTTDAGGALRLVGGFAKATVYGKIIGKGGELRYTKNGQPVLNFSINARASWKDANDEWQNTAAFVRTTVWGPLAEALAELEPAKGMEALIEGRPNRGSFDKDGRKVYTLDVTASRVVLADGVQNSSGGGGSSLDSLPSLDDMFGGADDDNDDSLPF